MRPVEFEVLYFALFCGQSLRVILHAASIPSIQSNGAAEKAGGT